VYLIDKNIGDVYDDFLQKYNSEESRIRHEGIVDDMGI